MKDWFRQFSRSTADALGSAWAFVAAALFIVVWAATGPLFHFSDLWQLIANTVTNVVTFLMVFLIQSSQNRDTKATQLKLDELLRAVEGARTGLVNLEALTDDDLEQLQHEFARLGRRAHREGRAAAAERERDAGGAKEAGAAGATGAATRDVRSPAREAESAPRKTRSATREARSVTQEAGSGASTEGTKRR